MKYIRCLVLFGLLAWERGTLAQSVEYTVKASFIEKIARFTNWKTVKDDESFVITVLGESPFNGELENLAKRTKIKGKPIVVNYVQKYEEVKQSHVVFICASMKNQLPGILDYLSKLQVLAISDSPGFCRKGVHVNFYIDRSETVKFEMNPSSIANAGLVMDLQLLSMGKIINQN